MIDITNALALMEGGKPELPSRDHYSYTSLIDKRNRFEAGAGEIRATVRQGEAAVIEAEAIREVMKSQARTIAELQAEVARLTRTEEIEQEKKVDNYPDL